MKPAIRIEHKNVMYGLQLTAFVSNRFSITIPRKDVNNAERIEMDESYLIRELVSVLRDDTTILNLVEVRNRLPNIFEKPAELNKLMDDLTKCIVALQQPKFEIEKGN